MPKKSRKIKPTSLSYSSAHASSSVSIWFKPYFLKEQQEFYTMHPSANYMLTIFILCVTGFLLFIGWKYSDIYYYLLMAR